MKFKRQFAVCDFSITTAIVTIAYKNIPPPPQLFVK